MMRSFRSSQLKERAIAAGRRLASGKRSMFGSACYGNSVAYAREISALHLLGHGGFSSCGVRCAYQCQECRPTKEGVWLNEGAESVVMRVKPSHPFWLIFACPGNPLTLWFPLIGETLPVFSFVEEAVLYLCAKDDVAWIEEATCEDLISLLCGPSSDVERVALDPPGSDEALMRLVSMSREDFLRFLLGRVEAGPTAPPKSETARSRETWAIGG